MKKQDTSQTGFDEWSFTTVERELTWLEGGDYTLKVLNREGVFFKITIGVIPEYTAPFILNSSVLKADDLCCILMDPVNWKPINNIKLCPISF